MRKLGMHTKEYLKFSGAQWWTAPIPYQTCQYAIQCHWIIHEKGAIAASAGKGHPEVNLTGRHNEIPSPFLSCALCTQTAPLLIILRLLSATHSSTHAAHTGP